MATAESGAADARHATAQAGLPEQVLQAARCCLGMLQELPGFAPTRGVTLTLHMGIGAGRLTAFTVGGHLEKVWRPGVASLISITATLTASPPLFGQWEFFIAGEPIEQMSDAAERASAEVTSSALALSPAATCASRVGSAVSHC